MKQPALRYLLSAVKIRRHTAGAVIWCVIHRVHKAAAAAGLHHGSLAVSVHRIPVNHKRNHIAGFLLIVVIAAFICQKNYLPILNSVLLYESNPGGVNFIF